MTADQLTTDTAGCSPVALAIAKRICSVNLITQKAWTEDWDHAAFAADVAHMVDSELSEVYMEAAVMLLTIAHRKGLAHRYDLITADERKAFRNAVDLLKRS